MVWHGWSLKWRGYVFSAQGESEIDQMVLAFSASNPGTKNVLGWTCKRLASASPDSASNDLLASARESKPLPQPVGGRCLVHITGRY